MGVNLMDLSTFEIDDKYAEDMPPGLLYKKIIGKYRFQIYTGTWVRPTSDPLDIDLDINNYKSVLIEIHSHSPYRLLSQKDFDIRTYLDPINLRNWSHNDTYCQYLISIPTLEKIYFILNCLELGVSISNLPINNSVRQELPCKGCQKPNDIGATPCWWCGIEKPTI